MRVCRLLQVSVTGTTYRTIWGRVAHLVLPLRDLGFAAVVTQGHAAASLTCSCSVSMGLWHLKSNSGLSNLLRHMLVQACPAWDPLADMGRKKELLTPPADMLRRASSCIKALHADKAAWKGCFPTVSGGVVSVTQPAGTPLRVSIANAATGMHAT